MRQLANVAYYMLADGRDEEQLAELDDLIYRPLEDDRRTDTARVAALAAMNQPFTVVHQ